MHHTKSGNRVLLLHDGQSGQEYKGLFEMLTENHILFDVMASGFTGSIGSTFDYLSARTHYESLSRGVFDTRDLIYYVTII